MSNRSRRAAALRRRRALRRRWAAGSIALLMAAVIGMVVTRAAGGVRPTAADTTAVSTDLSAALAAVPAATLDRVGRGAPMSLLVPATGLPALRRDGRPVVVYIGAEYCPFCAAQRWPLAVALSRFGTFTGLRASHSATDDVYPATATMTFHRAGYTSSYLAFDGVETASNVRTGTGYALLDTLTGEQQQLLSGFDRPPYVPAQSAGAIPFLVVGDRYIQSGASVDPGLLAGLSTEDIMTALADPGSRVSQAVLGSANALTAALCELTGDQPAAVCSSASATVYKGHPDGR